MRLFIFWGYTKRDESTTLPKASEHAGRVQTNESLPIIPAQRFV